MSGAFHCCFHSQFPLELDAEYLFKCSLAICISCFGEISVQIFCSFLTERLASLLLSFKGFFLYILEQVLYQVYTLFPPVCDLPAILSYSSSFSFSGSLYVRPCLSRIELSVVAFFNPNNHRLLFGLNCLFTYIFLLSILCPVHFFSSS